MEKFTYLLQRYTDRVSTPQEREELFSLIQTREYDHILDKDLSGALQSEMLAPAALEERLLLDKIYSQKIKDQLNPKSQEDLGAHDSPAPIRIPVWRRLAAAAVVSGILFCGWFLIKNKGTGEPIAAQEKNREDASNKSIVKFTDTQLVRLPDGSTVLLNDGSELSYSPVDFGVSNREVRLSGEGFFDIKHDQTKPFRVQTGKIITTVLGTAFNIRSFSNEPEVKVTVTRGKVQVGDHERTFGMLVPDEQLVINTATSGFVKSNIKAETVTEWKDKFLIMDNVTMNEAVQMMSQKFKVKFSLQNKDLSNCHITASFFNNEGIDHVLQVVSAVNQLTYSVQPDGNVILTGGDACE